VHVAAATETGTIVQSLTLAKEQRDREGEEEVVARMTLNALAEAFGLAERVALPLLPGEILQREEQAAGLLARFLAGQPAVLCFEPDGRLRAGGEPPGVLLPGSFNPLHEGHRGMAQTAARVLGRSVAFELGVANAEKPPLTEGEVRRRMAQFVWQAPLWLTRAPTFLEKSRLFPGAVFVVGVDTAVRIVDPRFYGDSAEAMRTALAEIHRHGCRFLVAGRLAGEKFLELEEVEMPEEFRDLFTALPAELFRVDVSSTQLRKG
jgi:Cytidylyltransferase-like